MGTAFPSRVEFLHEASFLIGKSIIAVFFSLPHCDFGALPGSFLRKERAVFCYSLALSGFDVGRLGSAKQTIGRIRRNFVLLDGWDNRNK
jgi:hypothetical protein